MPNGFTLVGRGNPDGVVDTFTVFILEDTNGNHHNVYVDNHRADVFAATFGR